MDRRLVLFDIDGTILTAGGASRRAVTRALHEVFGTAGPIDTWPFGGKTDPQIARELLTAADFTPAAIDRDLPRLLSRYLELLAEELPGATVDVKPGFPELLDRLAAEPSVTLGLLTGNLEEGARLKLGHVGLWDHFVLGVYGSDDPDRYRLPALAVARAREYLGVGFEGKQVVVIGDTPHDVGCGRSLGVRTVAVATGRHPVEELAACGPDHLFRDLGDVPAALEAILS